MQISSQVLSAMFQKFLADVDEYDTDDHRTITPSPEGSLISMSEEALWFFNQWACLKYGAYPYISPWEQVAERVLHGPEPVVLACGCFVEPGEPHPKEDCWTAMTEGIELPKTGMDAWIWRLYAKQHGPEVLAAEHLSQVQQEQDAFVTLVMRFTHARPEALVHLRTLQSTAESDGIEAWLADCWNAFIAWVRCQDDRGGTQHFIVSHYRSRMAQDPERTQATWEALRRALLE